MTALSLQGMSKHFGSLAAVDDVSIEIPAGCFVCLLGPSGCGKTTLLRLIAGLEEPSAGSLHAGGREITTLAPNRRDFGMVFQSLALFPHLDVADNIAYPLAIRGHGRRARMERVEALLELVQLPGLGARRIHQLSGGQRQRVAIARGLAIDPKVFLLDEPLSALDANLREHMQVELRQLQQRLGVTTLVVTHDQKEALTMADLVIVMKDGKVQQAGAPMEIYRDPANAFVAGFIGQSNLLPCTLESDGSVDLSGTRLALDPQDRVKTKPGPAMLSIRPEDLRPDPQGPITARVAFIRDLGESVQIALDFGETRLQAVFAPRERPDVAIGDALRLAPAPGGIVVLAPPEAPAS
ncbi:MAG: ABC transporter ATP-binding protein [Salinarimonas sp.]